MEENNKSYDIVVIGCGASSYGFLKGLEKNSQLEGKKIAILCPNRYKSDTLETDINDISPKFLQKENLLSLSYYLGTLSNFIQNNFYHIGVHGIGGMCRLWGGSIGTFDKKTLCRNGFDYNDFVKNYSELEGWLPFSGNKQDSIANYFYLKYTDSVKVSSRIYKLFGKYLTNTFKVGYPRLLVRNNCDSCNQCLVGCKNNSVWYPLEQDFLDINLDATLIKDCYVSKIIGNDISCLKNNKEVIINSKYIVLGAGVIQNYKLLSTLENMKNKKAKIYTTPAFAFAFFKPTKNTEKKFFGMGNATFILEHNNESSFYGNLYDGYSLSISKGKVFSKNIVIDGLLKIISKYMVFGAGFISSDYALCSIEEHNGNFVVNGEYSKDYQKKMTNLKKNIKKFVRENNGILAYSKKVALGGDIHYGGGIPNDLYVGTLIKDGNLKGISHIKVIGGSTFSYLPPTSPTLSYITNSYRIGKNFIFKDISR